MRQKIFFLMALLCIGMTAAKAQGTLDYDKIGESSYFTDGQKSAIVIQCDTTMTDFSFYTTVFGSVTPKQKGIVNGQRIYSLEFNVGAGGLKTKLQVYCLGFNLLSIPVDIPEAKKAYIFKVFNPDDFITKDGYYRSRKNGDIYFNTASYDLARNEYVTASNFTNLTPERLTYVKDRIATIDSIAKLNKMASDSARAERYDGAIYMLNLVRDLNPNDTIASSNIVRYTQKLNDLCTSSFNTGSRYYRNHQFSKAEPYFRTVVDNNCNFAVTAQSHLDEIAQRRYNKRVLPHVIYYLFDGSAPIGVGYGIFNEHKMGGFINFRMNNALFQSFQSEWVPKNSASLTVPDAPTANTSTKNQPTQNEVEDADNPGYISIAFGFTIKLYCPNSEKDYFKLWGMTFPKYPSVHLMIGPGYAGMNAYKQTTYKYNKTDATKPITTYETTFVHAIAPQFGLMVKWSRLSLFYVCEPHFVIRQWADDDHSFNYGDISYIKKVRHMFGLGIAL